jgi:RND superfamily putative drug exporter
MERIGGALVGRRAKWILLTLWLGLSALFPVAAELPSIENDEILNYLPATAQSTRVEQFLKRFPEGQTTTAVVVYARPGGLNEDDLARLSDQREDVLREVPLARKFGPIVQAEDGEAALFLVRVPRDVRTLPSTVNRLRDQVGDAPAGAVVGVTGPAAFLADEKEALEGIDSKLLIAAGATVTILLLLIYRSPLLCVIPLVTTILALIVARAAVYALALYADVVVTGIAAGVLNILIFGAGTDYALLLIARYRQELQQGDAPHQAMARALRYLAPTLIASSATVALGLLCLLVATLKSDKDMGPIAAIGIFCAVTAALTAMPPLFVICGRSAFWPSIPHSAAIMAQPESIWVATGARIARRPRLVWLLTVVILAAGASGLAGLHLGLPKAESFIGSFGSVQGRTLLDAHFPAGAAAPTVAIARSPSATQVSQALEATPGVMGVRVVGQADDLTELAVILQSRPDSPDAYATIGRMRERLSRLSGADALVGGPTAIDADVDEAAKRDRTVVMPLVLGVVLAILGLLMRSIVAPLVLVATVVLSFAAALGISSLVFDWVFGFAGIDQSVLLDAFIFLIALGTDYNIFLMNRARQEAVEAGTRSGLQRALTLTGGVITSAGIVLAATFAALALVPLVVLVEIGFTVAFGILLDTVVVRSMLVPALVLDVGSRIWWPSDAR